MRGLLGNKPMRNFGRAKSPLLRSGGRLGFVVPSGLYSDHGTGGLRQLFLDRCRWEWLFGFENRDGMTIQPWPVVMPAVLVILLTISTNLLGDAVARSLGKSIDVESMRR